MKKLKYCVECDAYIEEKWWVYQPCPGAIPTYSYGHRFDEKNGEAVITKETPDYVLVRYRSDSQSSSRLNRYLCMGGQHGGIKLSTFEAGPEYIQYNRGDNRYRAAKRNRCVLIHKSLIQ